MSYFILPVTVESRKILFLTLEQNFDSTNPLKNVGEDEYIVEIPEHQSRNMLSIPLEKQVQSRHEEIDDIPIKNFFIEFEYNSSEKLLTIVLDQTRLPDDSKAKKSIPIDGGFLLKADRSEKDIRLMLSTIANAAPVTSDHFFINFHLKLKDEDLLYSAPMKLCLAERKDIRLTGFDFGSEASQIHDAVFDSSENANINPVPSDLFASVKNHHPDKNKRNEEYMQHDDANLYKSIFFIKKEINWPGYVAHTTAPVPESEINTLTLHTEVAVNGFTDTWVQIPNLKLIQNNESITNDYKFIIKANGQRIPVNLTNLRFNIYASLLREMILNHMKDQQIHSDIYLRFTLLAPNIYNIGQINDTKKIIRSIIMDSANSFTKHIKGLEISSLSESDSAFLGHLVDKPVKGGDYFILIDCGKGTTDFSVLQAHPDNSKIFKPIYRNGFAGAGNLITYAFFQSAMHFLEEKGTVQSTVNFQNFLKNGLPKGSLNDIKNKLFDLAEKWKRNHADAKLQAQIETEWNAARSEDLSMENVFAKSWSLEDIMSLLKIPNHVYDWGGYIQSAINNIVNKIRISLKPVIKHMNREGRCAGVLFTGRGFKFGPLKTETLSTLQRIKGMENVSELSVKDRELKSICLKGVFTKGNVSYNDIVSTPIEISRGSLEQYTTADIKPKGAFNIIGHYLNKITNPGGSGYFYDEATNNIRILNHDFDNCQFLIGGNIYEPDWTEGATLEESFLVLSRKGFFIRAKDTDNKVFLIEVHRVNSQHKEFSEDSVKKSLFPGYYDPQLLKNTL